MKIGDIDKNLSVSANIPFDDVVWINAKESPCEVRGLAVHEVGKPFLRMPEDKAKAVSDSVAWLNRHTAGGRIRFATNSPYIAIKAVMPDNETMAHITMLGQSGFDLYAVEDGHETYYGSFIPGNRSRGYSSWKPTDSEMRTYVINMPLYDPVEEVYIGLSSSAEISSPESYRYEKPVLYYGSSITQGGCASRPGNSYQAMISRTLSCDYINLGFSGSARGEDAIAEYLASLDPSVFVCDYDHNAPSPEHLEKTHYPLYKRFRKAHPDTPIIFVSKPDFNPKSKDDIRRREVIIETFNLAVNSGDENVYFVDGSHLFDGEMRDSCTVDGCHPNDLGFYRMARGIGEAVKTALNKIDNI